MRDVSGQKSTYQCVIDTFKLNQNINTGNYQHKVVDKHIIKNSKVLIDPPVRLIWITLAKVKWTSGGCHLVNILWSTDLWSKKYRSLMCKKLFNDTIELLNHDVLNATRRSWSNDVTTFYNYNILSLLKTNSAFPRKGEGVKVV